MSRFLPFSAWKAIFLATAVVAYLFVLLTPRDPEYRLHIIETCAALVSLYFLFTVDNRKLTVRDAIVCGVVLIACVAGHFGLAVSGFALYLILTGQPASADRAAGIVMSAIAVRAVWAPIVLETFAPVLVRADASLVDHLLSLWNPAVHQDGAVVMSSTDFGIEVTMLCSSVHNISYAALCWVTITMMARKTWVARDLWVGAATMAAQVSINVVRLAIIASSSPLYDYWHDGTGKYWVKAAGTLAALAIATAGAHWAGRQPLFTPARPLTAG